MDLHPSLVTAASHVAYAHDVRGALRPYWHAVARTRDVAPGAVVPISLLGEALALWRSPEGALALVDDRCPHRGTALSAGSVTAAGTLRCPYHAWEFGLDGGCTRIPQLAHDRTLPGAELDTHRVVERYGFVWACLVPEGDERRPLPSLPVVDDGSHWFWIGEPVDFDGQCFRQVENFCDVAHFSVLHLDTFGNASGAALEPSRVERDDWCLRFTFDYPSVDPTAPPGPDRPVFDTTFAYEVELPLSVRLGGASGPGSVMFIHSSPVDAFRTRVFWGCAFPEGTDIDGPQYAAIEDAIWRPDRAIVAGQRPKGLPLGAAELHLPVDRFAIAYRRALAELGVPDAPRLR